MSSKELCLGKGCEKTPTKNQILDMCMDLCILQPILCHILCFDLSVPHLGIGFQYGASTFGARHACCGYERF